MAILFTPIFSTILREVSYLSLPAILDTLKFFFKLFSRVFDIEFLPPTIVISVIDFDFNLSTSKVLPSLRTIAAFSFPAKGPTDKASAKIFPLVKYTLFVSILSRISMDV